MYFELPNYGAGPTRYRYIPVDITPQNFHRNRRDDSMLIVDNPALISAVREAYPLCYGSINLILEDCEIGCCSLYRPALYLRLIKFMNPGETWEVPYVIVTDEELTALVRMRYPQESKDPAFIDNIIQAYHFQTDGEIINIKIDNPPPGLTELFENSRSGS